MVFDLNFAEHAQTYVKKGIFICFKNPHFFLFSWVLEVKLIFQDKFYEINAVPVKKKMKNLL